MIKIILRFEIDAFIQILNRYSFVSLNLYPKTIRFISQCIPVIKFFLLIFLYYLYIFNILLNRKTIKYSKYKRDIISGIYCAFQFSYIMVDNFNYLLNAFTLSIF